MLLSSTVDQGFLFTKVRPAQLTSGRRCSSFLFFALFDQNLEMQRSEILAQMSQKFVSLPSTFFIQLS